MSTVEILEPRLVPLGGPRARPVRRTLPQRKRSLIGPWCFVDHYGPDAAADSGVMKVAPHPHTGLQTVSWLFAGEIEHRDSAGNHAFVRPGELNLMTAGRGIQHSEVSTSASPVLHGVQLWLALPDAHRNVQPFFENFVPHTVMHRAATLRVFLGALAGSTSPVKSFSGIVGAQIDLPADSSIELPVDPTFEHGVLLDKGALEVNGENIPLNNLGFIEAGSKTLALKSGAVRARALLIGGPPFGEEIVMWWNFIGRSHEEIVQFRQDWQSEVIAGTAATGRFGAVRGYDGEAIPAPELPNVRLKPRG